LSAEIDSLIRLTVLLLRIAIPNDSDRISESLLLTCFWLHGIALQTIAIRSIPGRLSETRAGTGSIF